MIKEMETVHKLQAKVGKEHTKAFKQLSAELAQAKEQLSSFANSQLQDKGSAVDAFDAKQKGNTQRILGVLRSKVSDLSAKLRDLREETKSDVAAERGLAKVIESGLVKSDKEMLDRLAELSSVATRVGADMDQHKSIIQSKMRSQQLAERTDVADAGRAADDSFASIAGTIRQTLAESKEFIHSAVQSGLASLKREVDVEGQAEKARWSSVLSEMRSMNSTISSQDRERLSEVLGLQKDFEEVSRRLSEAIASVESRASSSASTLKADREQLTKASDSSMAFLTGRLGSGLASVQNKTDAATEAVERELARLRLALSSVSDGAKRFGDAEGASQLRWNAQRYNFEGEVHRESEARRVALSKRISSSLDEDVADVARLVSHSDGELHDVEADTESDSRAMNRTIAEALYGLERNVTLRAEEMQRTIAEYALFNSSALTAKGVSKKEAEGVLDAIDEMQETLKRIMGEDNEMVEGREKQEIANVDFNASQTLQRYKRVVREDLADGLRELTAGAEAAQRRAKDHNSEVQEELEASEKAQSVVDGKQLDLISKLARVAKRHATHHKLDLSLAEVDLHGLQADLVDFKAFMEGTHAKNVAALRKASLAAVASATTRLGGVLDENDKALIAEIASQAKRVDASIAKLQADVKGSERGLTASLSATLGKVSEDHAKLVANATHLERQLALYRTNIHTRVADITSMLTLLDKEMSRTKVRVGTAQHESHAELRDMVMDEVSRLANALDKAIGGDRTALMSLAGAGFGGLKTGVIKAGEKMRSSMAEISDEQEAVDRQSIADHGVHMNAVDELRWNQGNISARFGEYMSRLERRLQSVQERIERGLGTDGENQRYGAWQEKIEKTTHAMEERYSSMLTAEREDVQRLLDQARVTLLGRVASLNETLRMAHAEVKAGSKDFHLSDTSQHEAVMQRVKTAENYQKDYIKNIDGLAAKEGADLHSLTSRQRRVAARIEAQRAADRESMLSRLEEGIASVKSKIEKQLSDGGDSLHEQLDQGTSSEEERIVVAANHSEASADTISHDIDELEEQHATDSQNVTAELGFLRDAEDQAEEWSKEDESKYDARLVDLEKELRATIASLTSVQGLQLKLLNSAVAEAQSKGKSETEAVQSDLLSRIRVVSSSVSTAKAQLSAVHTLIAKEQEQDRADVKRALAQSLSLLKRNMTDDIAEGTDKLKSELRARMSQLHSVISLARSKEQKTLGEMETAIDEANRGRVASSASFLDEMNSMEQSLNHARAEQLRKADDVKGGVARATSELSAMLGAAAKDRHSLLKEMQGKLSAGVSEASGGLWGALEASIKAVDDKVKAGLSSLTQQLPKERASFRTSLGSVQDALTAASKLHDENSLNQAKAVHALALQLDSLSQSAATLLPKSKQRAADIKAALAALDEERHSQHLADLAAVSQEIDEELAKLEARMRKDMMSQLDGVKSNIDRNATALAARTQAEVDMVTTERHELRADLSKYQKQLQKDALMQAAATNRVHTLLVNSESSLQQQVTALNRKFIKLSDTVSEGRSQSVDKIADIKASLHDLASIVERGKTLRGQFQDLAGQVEESKKLLVEGELLPIFLMTHLQRITMPGRRFIPFFLFRSPVSKPVSASMDLFVRTCMRAFHYPKI